MGAFPVQKFGIENLKLLLRFSFGLTKELIDDFKDGKIQFIEQLGLVSKVLEGVVIAKAWPQIKLELKELIAPEKQKLREYVISEFNVISTNNKAVDEQIKKSLALAVLVIELIEGFKAIKQN